MQFVLCVLGLRTAMRVHSSAQLVGLLAPLHPFPRAQAARKQRWPGAS
jgi:hypothetical protein